MALLQVNILQIVCLMILPALTLAIKISRVEVPQYPVVGNQATLTCNYELEKSRDGKEKDEKLYSVKWYKDSSEFYRFVPKDNPPSQVFNVAWITVDQNLSHERAVTLKDLSLQASGIYTCEVSSEAPRFKTSSRAGEMKVIDLPDERPIITGGNHRGYRVGEWLDVNCTSPLSSPPSGLNWYINDEQPTESYVVQIPPQKEAGELWTARLRLRFQLKRQHFVQGHVSLKCTARIYSEYFTSTSTSYPGLGLGEKALESRRTNDGWRTRGLTTLVTFGIFFVKYLMNDFETRLHQQTIY